MFKKWENKGLNNLNINICMMLYKILKKILILYIYNNYKFSINIIVYY
jgi:hypothetical protein